MFPYIAIIVFLNGWIVPVNDGVTAAVGVAIILFVSLALRLLTNKFEKRYSEE